jgi:hypothetical protein
VQSSRTLAPRRDGGAREKKNTFMKIRDSLRNEVVVPAVNSQDISDLGTIFDGPIEREFADQDVVHHEHYGCRTLCALRSDHDARRRRPGSSSLLRQALHKSNSQNAKVTPISCTVGKDQVVDELIVSFTHDTQWDYLLPEIPPIGKRVELPHVVVMKFENGKVAHEHVWWYQASLLVQVGLLNPSNLPVAGVEQARRLLRVSQEHKT